MALTVSRILHAGYVFEHDGTRIVFDPIFENPFSRNCHAFPPIRFDYEQIRQQRFAAVFISHFHDDHCSLESLDLIDRDTPIYLYCLFDELFDLIRALGFKQVQALSIDTPVHVDNIEIIPRRALESEVDSMFHIKAGGLHVLNVVDASIDPATLKQLSRYAPWDLVLWPFQTMRETEVIAPLRAPAATGQLPEEWLQQLQRLRPRYLVPSSCQFVLEPWSWYNRAFFPMSYAGFQQQLSIALPYTQIVRLNPGVTVTLTAQSHTAASLTASSLTTESLAQGVPLPWIHPVGEQDVDYFYDPALIPPSTADIARQFVALSDQQMLCVMDYCRTGLPEKYRTLDPSDDTYFQHPRHWRLSVYDAMGVATHFEYLVGETPGGEQTIAPLTDATTPLAWCTEVVAAKLYAALTSGETLTTLYLRINDRYFDAAIEADLEYADLVDDPLIRCLFDESLGAYQRDQLKRLGKGE